MAELLEDICLILPSYLSFVSSPVESRVSDIASGQYDAVREMIHPHEKQLWFEMMREFKDMHISHAHKHQYWHVPASGDVFHSIVFTRNTALLNTLYYGSVENICPRVSHQLSMYEWQSLMESMDRPYISREVYWMFLYGLTSNDTFFESVVRRVSASNDTSWVTSSTRSVIHLASCLHPQRVAEYNVAPWRSTNV